MKFMIFGLILGRFVWRLDFLLMYCRIRSIGNQKHIIVRRYSDHVQKINTFTHFHVPGYPYLVHDAFLRHVTAQMMVRARKRFPCAPNNFDPGFNELPGRMCSMAMRWFIFGVCAFPSIGPGVIQEAKKRLKISQILLQAD